MAHRARTQLDALRDRCDTLEALVGQLLEDAAKSKAAPTPEAPKAKGAK